MPCRHLRPTSGREHTCICPVTQTRLDIPRPLITESRSTGRKAEMFSSAGGVFDQQETRD